MAACSLLTSGGGVDGGKIGARRSINGLGRDARSHNAGSHNAGSHNAGSHWGGLRRA
jgi:hypothetical protein